MILPLKSMVYTDRRREALSRSPETKYALGAMLAKPWMDTQTWIEQRTVIKLMRILYLISS